MDHIELMEVLNSRNNLAEKFGGWLLLDPRPLDNIVDQLASRGVLHDEVKTLKSLNDLWWVSQDVNQKSQPHRARPDVDGESF